MKQVVTFDPSKGGTKPLWCLRNTRLGYGIGPKYYNASAAWAATEQHTTLPPEGVDVPVYFSWEVDGHIGVSLADGRFWSDGKIYPSIKAYTDEYPPVYLGWGESINDIKVVEGVDMSKDKASLQEIDTLFLLGLKRHVDASGANTFVGKPWIICANSILKSKEYKIYSEFIDHYPNLVKQNAALKKQVSELEKGFTPVQETLYKKGK